MGKAEVDNMASNSCESLSRGTQERIIATIWKCGEITKDIFATDKQQQPQFEITAGDASRMFNTEVLFPLDDETAFEACIHDQDCLGQLENVDHLNWMKQLARVGIALLGTPDFPQEKSIKPEFSRKNTATENIQQDDRTDIVSSVKKKYPHREFSVDIEEAVGNCGRCDKFHMTRAARIFGKRVGCYRIEDREITQRNVVTIQLQ